jgi:hypothetical protein
MAAEMIILQIGLGIPKRFVIIFFHYADNRPTMCEVQNRDRTGIVRMIVALRLMKSV